MTHPPTQPISYLDELGRKSIHLGSCLFALAYHYTDRTFMLGLMIPIVLFAISVEVARQCFPSVEAFVQRFLGRILRREEKRVFTGATYVAISVLLCAWLFDKRIAITVMLFMSVSDALASLVGRKVGGPRLFEKSISGSIAFLVSALAVAYWQLPHAPLVGTIGALVATLVEAAPMRAGATKLDDNLTIPLIAGAVMTGLLMLVPA